MKYYILVLFIITIGFFVLSLLVDNNVVKILSIILITIFYHSCIRPLTGCFINTIYHNKMNYYLWWFKERKFEKVLYKIFQVKCWKNVILTYDKTAYDIKNKSIEEILGATCQAEIVHTIMFFLSFATLLLIIPYKEMFIFLLITSIFCAFIDLICIIIQRYNRPRLLKINEKLKKN